MFLIDGYAMLYRAHYAMIRNPLITSYGLPTSALFGFLNQLFRILNKENPDYIATIFDRKEKTFRHKKYPDYKANRDPMPEELQVQLPHLWKLIDALEIVNLSKKGYEADDIIGTLAVDGTKNDLEVFIVSGDKDFMQLINDNVFLYAPGTKNKPDKIYDKDGVKDRWGVPPEKIIDLFGLMGDSSDNIPGVLGVGPKSAMKLIARMHQSLQSIIPLQVGLYDDAFNLNCVGDTFQSKNTPTILIEAGHYHRDYRREHVRKFICVAILEGLSCIAKEAVSGHSFDDYFKIPLNKKLFFDVIIRNTKEKTGNQSNDIGIQFKEVLIDNTINFVPIIKTIGNLSRFYGHYEIEKKQLQVGSENDFVLINNELFALKPDNY